jgi:hypothetical protein
MEKELLMPRDYDINDSDGINVEDRVFNNLAEIPDNAIIMQDGRLLVPADENEAEFIHGEDGFLYSTETGKVVAEVDEADNDFGYETEEDVDIEGEEEDPGYEEEYNDDEGYEEDDGDYEEYE